MSKQLFFKGVSLSDVKRVQKLFAVFQALGEYGIAVPSADIIASDEKFHSFVLQQAKLLKIPKSALKTALGANVEQKSQIIPKLDPPAPTSEIFTPLSTKIEKMYARSTEKPDPRKIRTPETLKKAVKLYHKQFLNTVFIPQAEEFSGDYIKFRSQMRAIRFDYQVQNLDDKYLQLAISDSLKAACLVWDLKEIMKIQNLSKGEENENIIQLVLFIEELRGQSNSFVQSVVMEYAVNRKCESQDKYLNSLLQYANKKFVV